MKKIVLFDVDGTLVNAGGAGKRALNKAIMEMGGVKDVCNFFELQGETDRVNFQNAFYFAFKKKMSVKDYEKIKKLYLKYLGEEVEYSVKKRLYHKIKGVDKLLDILSRNKDILIGLGTGNLQEGAYIKLTPSGLSKYFLFGGFGEKYEKRSDMLKSAVKSAEKICGEKIKPYQVYVIGDTEKDVIGAKTLGYHSACVLDGFGDKIKIHRSSPELIEKDFSNIDVWLIWLGIKKDPKGIKRGTYICPDTPIEHAYYGMTGLGSWTQIEGMIKYFREKKQKK